MEYEWLSMVLRKYCGRVHSYKFGPLCTRQDHTSANNPVEDAI